MFYIHLTILRDSNKTRWAILRNEGTSPTRCHSRECGNPVLLGPLILIPHPHLDPDPKLLLKLPPNFGRHFLRRRIISILKLVAVGGAAHDDAVDGRV